MTSLLIETCTEHSIIAFFENETITFIGEIPKGHNSSKFAMNEIDKGLKELNLKVQDLHYIAVGVGPGSYTGIRVGVTVAKVFAYARTVPLIALCTLDGFVPEKDGSFISIIDAKIGGAYFRMGRRKNGAVRWETDPCMEQLSNIAKLCEVDFLISPNSVQLQNKVQKIYPDKKFEWIDIPPSLSNLMKTAEKKFQNQDFSSDGEVEILYLRKTQAEIEKQKDI